MNTKTDQFLEALRRLDNAEQVLRHSHNELALLDAAEAEAEAMDELDRLFQGSSLTHPGCHAHHSHVEAA